VAQGVALMNSCLKNEATGSFENEGVRVRSVENCLQCGRHGQPLYIGLRDRLYEAPGVWSLFRCRDCGFVWLNPQPVREDIVKLYSKYGTHGPETSAMSPIPRKAGLRHRVFKFVQAAHFGYATKAVSRFWKGIGRVVGFLPLLRDWAGAAVMFLPVARGRLIDVGSGDGRFLAAMREEGWQVLGVEPDPEAAHFAREGYGIEVVTGQLEGTTLPGCSADAITMHHVIEHVPDPVALLRECCRILRPGGILVAITPNVGSMGHRRFGENWRGLEPPRHLYLFSPRTLRLCAEKAGLKVVSLRTISRLGRELYIFSHALRHDGAHLPRLFRPSRLARYQAWPFLFFEEALRLLNAKVGEELVLIATRPG
jgi:SAM-dependent methyltransferase